MSNFLASFIAECINKGAFTPAEMCQKAETRIKEINKEITLLDKLRIEKNNLVIATKHLGKSSEPEYKGLDFSIPESKLTEQHRKLCIDICSLLKEEDSSICMTDIFGALSGSDDDSIYLEDRIVFWTIKWLTGHNIISRDPSIDKNVIRGPNWENRPSENK